MMDQEEPWIEDGNNTNGNDVEDDDYGSSLFADTNDGEFKLTFEGGISVTLKGVKSKYPMFLQSTGLTLWKSSKTLCSHLCANPDVVRGKKVIELGAGLGLAGIIAHKLGASKVILTDGDTDTLENMRDNVSFNIESRNNEDQDSVLCKQLRWGMNVEKFLDQYSSDTGFDVVMGSDIIYAKEYLKDLFKTISLLLSSSPGSIFLLSHMKRNPNLSFESVYECAKKNGFQWSGPSGDSEEGLHRFFKAPNDESIVL